MIESNIIKKYEPLWGEWTTSSLLSSNSYGAVFTVTNIITLNNQSILKLITLPTENQNKIISEYFKNNSQKINDFYETSINNILLTLKNFSKLKNHSNIISIDNFMIKKDSDKNKWHIFLNMEYATPLLSYLKNNSFTEKDVIRLALGLCNAISSLHNVGITHENIKESNVFISKNNTFKISDFNIIKEIQSEPLLDSSIIPPEIADGKEFTKYSDIYSLGLLLYKLCNNGKLPFIPSNKSTLSNSDIREAIEMRLSGKPLPPPMNASPKLSKIILIACSHEPSSRYKNIDDMKNVLKNVLQVNEPVHNNKYNSELITNSYTQVKEMQISPQDTNNLFLNQENTINYLPTFEKQLSHKKKWYKNKFSLFLLLATSSILSLLFAYIILSNSFKDNKPTFDSTTVKPVITSKKQTLNTPTNITSPNHITNEPTANSLTEKVNLIGNFSAEDNTYWEKRSLYAAGTQLYSTENPYDGKRSLKVELNNNLIKGTYSELTYFQSVKVKKGSNYRLSLYIRTNNISSNHNDNGQKGAFALILFRDEDNMLRYSITPYIKICNDWTKYTVNVKIPPTSTSDTVNIHLGICDEIGTAYFDFIKFEEIIE